MSTTLLSNGKIIDGSGNAAFEGHLLIEGDRISAVLTRGEKSPPAKTVIDSNGFVISPGFIDMHSHADWMLPLDDHTALLKALPEQGVTTLVGGNCGFSPAPFSDKSQDRLVKDLSTILMDKPLDFTWSSMDEFLVRIEEVKPAVNVAQLVGHASVRVAVADTPRGPMRPDELDTCLDEVRRSFDEGACGLSFGLGYDPGMYSSIDELEEFCLVAAEAKKPVTVHLKALSRISPTYPLTYLKPHNLRALREMIDVARNTEAIVQLSHFIFVGRKSWSTAEEAIQMVEDARREGIDVMIDAFPYTCGNTTVNAVLPYWFIAMLPKGYQNRWARARLRAELEIGFRLVGFFYKDFQVMDSAAEGWEDLNGLRLDEIARMRKTNFFNTLLNLSESSNGEALMLFHTYSGEPGNEKPLESVLSNDLCLFETDALMKSRGYPNPAAVGTFPKILGDYVREKKLFSLEDAVRRMTSASADRFGLKDRGRLAPGKAADVVVFDPDTIADTPPVGDQPAGKPKGIKHVFINGIHVVKDGSYVDGLRTGQVLRV